jgi:uncharacterized membrane protein YedE/YeeE
LETLKKNNNMMDFLRQPWPWYVAGPIIGVTVPLLLLVGNRVLGISSSLRHICAMCLPANVPFLKYNWKDSLWNIYFVVGLLVGGFIAGVLLQPVHAMPLSDATWQNLQALGISKQGGILPVEVYSWSHLFTWKHLIITVGGGFLVGFGTRYSGGCTSGHGIAGISMMQWPSLLATILFFAGGIITANFILPLLLK